MSTPSTTSVMKYFYDDAGGIPVDITAFVLANNDFEEANKLQETSAFGTSMPEYTPTGRGEIKPITHSGVYKTGTGTIDSLFANRVPEDPSATPRTYTEQWSNGRTSSVETHLQSFKRSANKDNGLTMFSFVLQPTGIRAEAGFVTP